MRVEAPEPRSSARWNLARELAANRFSDTNVNGAASEIVAWPCGMPNSWPSARASEKDASNPIFKDECFVFDTHCRPPTAKPLTADEPRVSRRGARLDFALRRSGGSFTFSAPARIAGAVGS